MGTLRQAKERQRNAMPLDQFPEDRRRIIELLVAEPAPPARWKYYGPSDSPRPLAMMESRAWLEWHWQRGIYPGSTRERIPQSLRFAVITRDGFVCQLCGGEVEPTDVHIDHIHPYSKGGPTSLDNLQVAHSTCNMRKGAKH